MKHYLAKSIREVQEKYLLGKEKKGAILKDGTVNGRMRRRVHEESFRKLLKRISENEGFFMSQMEEKDLVPVEWMKETFHNWKNVNVTIILGDFGQIDEIILLFLSTMHAIHL